MHTVLRLLSEVPSCWKTLQDTGGEQLKDLHCWSKKGADGVAHYDITVERIPYRELFPWGANFCYFRGSPRCHEIFHTLCSAAYTWSSLDRQHFVMPLFCYSRHIESVLNTQGPLSQAVLRVMGEEVNRPVYKAEA